MSILKLGKVRPTPKGAWTASSVYEAMDWVTHKGFAYQALINVPANKEPDTSPTYWMQTSMKGEKGEKGDKGEPGVQGAAGTNGRDGTPGTPGATGQTGAQGAQGPKGDQGLMGPQGAPGAAGQTGAQGAKGPKGDQGLMGPQGAQGPQGDTPPLSNAVNSTFGNVAASSFAVKIAYDKAVEACAPLTDLLESGIINVRAAPCPQSCDWPTETALGVVRAEFDSGGRLPAGGGWYYFALGIIPHAAVGNGFVITALATGVAPGGTKILDIAPGVTPWITCWRVF